MDQFWIPTILDTLQKLISIRKPKTSGLKRVATGSDSKRYQTISFAQLSNPLFENLKFDVIFQMYKINKLEVKSLYKEYTFQRKVFRACWVVSESQTNFLG